MEKPEIIIEDMCVDLPDDPAVKYIKLLTEKAINFAVNSASNGSVILVAGKAMKNFKRLMVKKYLLRFTNS